MAMATPTMTGTENVESSPLAPPLIPLAVDDRPLEEEMLTLDIDAFIKEYSKKYGVAALEHCEVERNIPQNYLQENLGKPLLDVQELLAKLMKHNEEHFNSHREQEVKEMKEGIMKSLVKDHCPERPVFGEATIEESQIRHMVDKLDFSSYKYDSFIDLNKIRSQQQLALEDGAATSKKTSSTIATKPSEGAHAQSRATSTKKSMGVGGSPGLIQRVSIAQKNKLLQTHASAMGQTSSSPIYAMPLNNTRIRPGIKRSPETTARMPQKMRLVQPTNVVRTATNIRPRMGAPVFVGILPISNANSASGGGRLIRLPNTQTLRTGPLHVVGTTGTTNRFVRPISPAAPPLTITRTPSAAVYPPASTVRNKPSLPKSNSPANTTHIADVKSVLVNSSTTFPPRQVQETATRLGVNDVQRRSLSVVGVRQVTTPTATIPSSHVESPVLPNQSIVGTNTIRTTPLVGYQVITGSSSDGQPTNVPILVQVQSNDNTTTEETEMEVHDAILGF